MFHYHIVNIVASVNWFGVLQSMFLL